VNVPEQSCVEDAVSQPAGAGHPKGRWGVPVAREGKLEKAFGTPELGSLQPTRAHQKLI